MEVMRQISEIIRYPDNPDYLEQRIINIFYICIFKSITLLYNALEDLTMIEIL